MRRIALASVAVAILLAASAGWLYQQYDAPGPLATAAAVVVPRGELAEVAADLQRNGVIARPAVFQLLALATRGSGPLHAGELLFPGAASLRDVLAILRTARPVQHRLTIPEGLTAARVAELVGAADALTGDSPVPEEGSILPETYSYLRDTSREQLMDRARATMQRALQKAWDARTPGLPLADKAEALVLASMVEREAAKPEDRPLIAAVFLNRLRLGMRLQSDVTVVYGASGGLGVLDHAITRAELNRDDAYNTYRIPALPIGPICMPGLASLRAATQPATTDALFFVADGAGGLVFAHSANEHLRNVARWHDAARARPQTSSDGGQP